MKWHDHARGAMVARLLNAFDDPLLLRRASKTVLVLSGTIAIVWGLSVWSVFTSALGLDVSASRMLQMEPFRADVLHALADRPHPETNWARPETLREMAIVNQRLFEYELTDARRTALDQQIAKSRDAVERALTVAPSDPFLWLALYWLKTTQSGFSPKNLPLLAMSYATGPNEGWIALRRNRLAFIASAFLPPELAAKAKREFVTLVSSGYETEAGDILAGPAWPQRETLLAQIEAAPLGARRQFASHLFDLGYDLNVPGVERGGDRPWR